LPQTRRSAFQRRRAAKAAMPGLVGMPPSGRLDVGSIADAARDGHAQAGAASSLSRGSEGGGARAAPDASAPGPAPDLASASASPFAAAARAAATGWDSAAPRAFGAEVDPENAEAAARAAEAAAQPAGALQVLAAAAGRPASARAAGAGGAVAGAAAGGEGGLRGASEGLAAALVEQTLLAMPRRPDAVTHIRCAPCRFIFSS